MKLKSLRLAAALSLMALAAGVLPANAAVIGVQVMASDGLYFSVSGPTQYWHTATGGYCGNLASWCRPATYRWTYDHNTTYGSVNNGRWSIPTIQMVYSRAYAFIPRRNATTRTAFYTISYANISSTERSVDQLAYYDQWAPLTPYESLYRIAGIWLTDGQFGFGLNTLDKVAFDEIKIES